MFIRQKKNKSGVISIQVIDKSNGKYKLLKTIGSSSDQLKINQLVIDAEVWLKKHQRLIEIDFSPDFVTFSKKRK
jgi:hypothetical protein